MKKKTTFIYKTRYAVKLNDDNLKMKFVWQSVYFVTRNRIFWQISDLVNPNPNAYNAMR